jgi:hypothetical protein
VIYFVETLDNKPNLDYHLSESCRTYFYKNRVTFDQKTLSFISEKNIPKGDTYGRRTDT